MSGIVLENDAYFVEFATDTGSLVRLRDKGGGCELITEPRLAESFRLLLPRPGMQANYVLGREQRLTRWQAGADGATLRWEGPLRNELGEYDLDVVLHVALRGTQVSFRLEVTNRSAFDLAEVWQAMVGGMTGLGTEGKSGRQTEAFVPTGHGSWNNPIFTRFGTYECLGVTYAEQTFGYPAQMAMPWITLHNPQMGRAVYFAALEEAPRAKVVRMALMPGVARGRQGSDWLRPEETAGEPVGVVMNWVSFPYTRPGQRFVGPEIVLECHAGGWRESAARYRQWFDSRFAVVDSRGEWIRQETAYLDLMFMLPEDNINLTFAQMPAWAAAARDKGFRALLVSGWQIGGHDRGYPQYQPDPRLGTADDLRRAIAACHELGMKVFFFVNLAQVDPGTEWFRQEGHRYLIQDERGFDYGPCGWGMGTLGARANMRRTSLLSCNPLHEPFRRLLVGHFRGLAELGADGVHIDKVFLDYRMDCNPALGVSPDLALGQGLLECVGEVKRACREVKADFCISLETIWDRMLSFADVNWWAQWDRESGLKAAFPQVTACSGITQPGDSNIVNMAALMGHGLLVGPGHYTRGADYAPMRQVIEYAAEIGRMRRELLEDVSRARPVGKDQLKVGEAGVTWMVYQNTATGRRAAVLANMSETEARVTGVSFAPPTSGRGTLYRPFEEPQEVELPVEVRIPGERMVILVEAADAR